ncbi:hypothetical protein ES332_A02G071900v1 [Gossypium tomentosum]|uniref:Uncharacterized protein n=1 Tax=Gossypium tomentosum TaxID=34277 RepID=A0A5D2RHK6_GOSTO|nr:hypothetical protein ES332_A02G071900v1 [Gossypium tomentosum]
MLELRLATFVNRHVHSFFFSCDALYPFRGIYLLLIKEYLGCLPMQSIPVTCNFYIYHDIILLVTREPEIPK